MREQGRLIEWNDERGFGFISPLGGDARYFVHVSQFPREQRRPMVTDLVTYAIGYDDRHRIVAHNVMYMAPTHARHEESAHPLHPVEIAIPVAFALVLMLLTAIHMVPASVLGVYALASGIAFAMYWQDKAAALSGWRRTPETSLIGIALLGGWPGAYLARHLLRHKTRKQPFRTYFWVAVAANCVLLGMTLIGLGQTPG